MLSTHIPEEVQCCEHWGDRAQEDEKNGINTGCMVRANYSTALSFGQLSLPAASLC